MAPQAKPPGGRAVRNAPARFDEAYYRRYYQDPSTRAATPAVARRQAQFIGAYLKHLEVPVRRVLDLGCGLGRTLRALQRVFPAARCHGVEFSPWLCEKHGWTRGSAVDYDARNGFDLVVCNDVLPSLDDADCASAISNIARLSRQAVFLGILTREDWEEHCDRDRTDPHVHLRPAAWYRRRLARHFIAVGGGLYIRKPPSVTLWSLDALD